MHKPSIHMCLVAGLVLLVQLPTAKAETAAKRETVTLLDIESGAASFEGKVREATIEEEGAPKEALFRQYGTRTFTAFEKHKELVAAVRKLNPKFDPHTMATSSLSSIVTVGDSTFLILVGCYPHICGGTHQVVALEPAANRVYLLEPTTSARTPSPRGNSISTAPQIR